MLLNKDRYLTLDDSNYEHSIAQSPQKMIVKIDIKIWYKTHNNRFLPIVEAYKTLQHYLKNCNYEVFILTNLIPTTFVV